MATYDHKQVLADYAHGRITPDTAVGHSLQHIDHPYAAQAAARNAWRAAIIESNLLGTKNEQPLP
jgi:hypothetical protein